MRSVTLCPIACVARNLVIGSQGGLPWSIPRDYQYFLDKVSGNAPCIIGRKSFADFGEAFEDPGRKFYVISSSREVVLTLADEKWAKMPNEKRQLQTSADYRQRVKVFPTFEAAVEGAAVDDGYERVWVVGGASVYAASLRVGPLTPSVNIAEVILYITELQRDAQGDTYFPEYRNLPWQVVDRRQIDDDTESYAFTVLRLAGTTA